MFNADPVASMIRETVPPPSGISNLITPAAAIAPGGYDPASGFATFSAALPTLGTSSQAVLEYAAVDGSGACTFVIKVSHDLNPTPYLLHISVDSNKCSVPADARSSTGQFTNQTYLLTWAT